MEPLMKLSGSVPCLSLNPLGAFHNNKYYIDDECLTNLNGICTKLQSEDPNARPLRRAIGFLDLLNKDLIPILIDSMEQSKIFYSTIKLLVELTTPIESLVSIGTCKRSTSMYIVIHELEQLLYSAKEAFIDGRATLVVLHHLHHLSKQRLLSNDDGKCVKHLLALICNILRIPERPPSNICNVETISANRAQLPTENCLPYLDQLKSDSTSYAVVGQQSRLVWNLFTQGLDLVLINLLAVSKKREMQNDWIASMVQLIALIYKDQCIEEMLKMVETCPLESKSVGLECESNSTLPLTDSHNRPHFLSLPPDHPCLNESCGIVTRGSQATTILPPEGMDPVIGKAGCNKRHKVSGEIAYSSMVTSTQHSNGSAKSEHCSQGSISSGFYSVDSQSKQENHLMTHSLKRKSLRSRCQDNNNKSYKMFETNITPAALSTPVSVKQNAESYVMSMKDDAEAEEKSPRKNRRYSRTTERFITMKILHYTPTKEDISLLLKDFLVDFLHNGYDTLVGQLHQQLLLHDHVLPLLDDAHLFWLISYFLPFISKLKLDIGRFRNVFTIDLLCYLTWAVVHQAEAFEMNSMQSTNDLEPCQRRLHLGTKAIFEYLQAVKVYSPVRKDSIRRNGSELRESEEEWISDLRYYLPEIRDLRQLFLLQLRHVNPVIQNRQHLRDVITTNHVLLLELERAAKQSPLGLKSFDLNQHLNQFCSKTIVNRYGIALEDFRTNSTFVNDCILTLMHHVGVDLGRVDLMCEPGILRSFRDIWEEDLNVCDDWKDLIGYVIHKFLLNYRAIGHLQMGSSNNGPNKLWDQRDSLPAESEHSKTLKSNRIQMEQNTVENNKPLTEVNKIQTDLLIAQLIDSGFQEQLNWIQSSLLTTCSARLGTYAGQEFRHPVTCLSLRMNVSCPIVPWTDVEASALRSETFLYLLNLVGLFPFNAQSTLYPRIPREWSADTTFSVALIFGSVNQEKIRAEVNSWLGLFSLMPDKLINEED